MRVAHFPHEEDSRDVTGLVPTWQTPRFTSLIPPGFPLRPALLTCRGIIDFPGSVVR